MPDGSLGNSGGYNDTYTCPAPVTPVAFAMSSITTPNKFIKLVTFRIQVLCTVGGGAHVRPVVWKTDNSVMYVGNERTVPQSSSYYGLIQRQFSWSPNPLLAPNTDYQIGFIYEGTPELRMGYINYGTSELGPADQTSQTYPTPQSLSGSGSYRWCILLEYNNAYSVDKWNGQTDIIDCSELNTADLDDASEIYQVPYAR